jgi:hypothetical protein
VRREETQAGSTVACPLRVPDPSAATAAILRCNTGVRPAVRGFDRAQAGIAAGLRHAGAPSHPPSLVRAGSSHRRNTPAKQDGARQREGALAA